MAECVSIHLYELLNYAEAHHLIAPEDDAYTLNRLLELFKLDGPECAAPQSVPAPPTATPILEALCDYGCRLGLCGDSAEQRELFSTRVMGVITPHPQLVREEFARLLEEKGPVAATTWFYQLCRDVDYIRVDRIARNVRFFRDSACGELEITINLSKPEKDPRDIAAQRNKKAEGYPLCMLCRENPGYAGRAGFPARQNHRIIPIALDGKEWYLQYSPYQYYNEHCIVFNREHVPMRISHESFVRLTDFVGQFPTYFIGSNADLPIVGGSILSHDHFQGGGYSFPMDKAGVRIALKAPDARVEAYLADWPMSCIVLKSKDRAALIAQADRLLELWRGWTDAECDVYAETEGVPHNTVTPVSRMEGDFYKLYIVLRNNRTSAEHPLGIFHPHAKLHHIKKENIGLIEVMGLFILPGRLKSELGEMQKFLTGERAIADEPKEDALRQHYAWICALAEKHGCQLDAAAAQNVLRDALADVCAEVLTDAGVYKNTPAGNRGVLRFLNAAGYREA